MKDPVPQAAQQISVYRRFALRDFTLPDYSRGRCGKHDPEHLVTTLFTLSYRRL